METRKQQWTWTSNAIQGNKTLKKKVIRNLKLLKVLHLLKYPTYAKRKNITKKHKADSHTQKTKSLKSQHWQGQKERKLKGIQTDLNPKCNKI